MKSITLGIKGPQINLDAAIGKMRNIERAAHILKIILKEFFKNLEDD